MERSDSYKPADLVVAEQNCARLKWYQILDHPVYYRVIALISVNMYWPELGYRRTRTCERP